jgi:hypothetical protein
MSDAKVEEHAGKMFLTEQELAISSGICDWFPGDWFIDPKIDYSRIGAPRVWLRPIAATNAINFSFGFSTQTASLFYGLIQPHSDHDSHLTMGIPFGSLFADLTLCQTVSLQRLGVSSDHTLYDQIALLQSGIRKTSTLNLPRALLSILPFPGRHCHFKGCEASPGGARSVPCETRLALAALR